LVPTGSVLGLSVLAIEAFELDREPFHNEHMLL